MQCNPHQVWFSLNITKHCRIDTAPRTQFLGLLFCRRRPPPHTVTPTNNTFISLCYFMEKPLLLEAKKLKKRNRAMNKRGDPFVWQRLSLLLKFRISPLPSAVMEESSLSSGGENETEGRRRKWRRVRFKSWDFFSPSINDDDHGSICTI